MKIFYFLVNWDGANSAKLHEYFFVKGNGFLYGLLLAAVVALVVALVYYFVLGRSVKSAKMGNWWICGIIALAVTFCVSNFVFIGQEPTKKEYAEGKKLENKITYKYSFYRSMDRALKPSKVPGETLIDKGVTKIEKEQLKAEQKKIAQNLNQGKDVRYPYAINTTIWCAIFFFLFSMLFKGMSQAAKTKPIKWPY